MRLDNAPFIDLLETAYHDGYENDEWRLALLRPLLQASGATAAVAFRFKSDYDENGGVRFRLIDSVTAVGELVIWSDDTIRDIFDAPGRELAFGRSHGTTYSQASGLGAAIVQHPTWRKCWRVPIVDSLGLVSRDADGWGMCLCVGLDRTESTNPRQQTFLMRAAFHLAAGDRLRRAAHRRLIDDAEAIFSPNGKLLHAQDTAKNKRDSLTEGRLRRDEARKTKHDAEKALEIWRGLIAGRWSLVDHYDTDGKRFLLAMKNTPKVDPCADLTPRERRVTALVAMGHRDREIAYTLGLSKASVTSSLHRARTKLDVTSRTELAARWREGRKG